MSGCERAKDAPGRPAGRCLPPTPVTCPPRGLLAAPGGGRPGPGPLLGHLLGDSHDAGGSGGGGPGRVGPGAQRRRWGGPPGRRRSCGRSEGSPGRRARSPAAAPAMLSASFTRDAARSMTPPPPPARAPPPPGELSGPRRAPRPARPPPRPQGRRPPVPRRRKRRPPRPPARPGQCGRGDGRVVRGNRGFGPTPPPRLPENEGPGGWKRREERQEGGRCEDSGGKGETQLPQLLRPQKRGSRHPRRRVWVFKG